jgi:hypothetical protein
MLQNICALQRRWRPTWKPASKRPSHKRSTKSPTMPFKKVNSGDWTGYVPDNSPEPSSQSSPKVSRPPSPQGSVFPIASQLWLTSLAAIGLGLLFRHGGGMSTSFLFVLASLCSVWIAGAGVRLSYIDLDKLEMDTHSDSNWVIVFASAGASWFISLMILEKANLYVNPDPSGASTFSLLWVMGSSLLGIWEGRWDRNKQVWKEYIKSREASTEPD